MMMTDKKVLMLGAVMLASLVACAPAGSPSGSPAMTSTAAAEPTATVNPSPTGTTSSAAPSPTIIAALPSASRWGHYGAPGNVDSASDAAGWSPQEQQAATDFAVQTMQVFAMDTDAKTWHQYMDSRVTDRYRQQLERFNPSLNPVREVKGAVYTEFSSDPTKAVVRVSTNDGVYVVTLAREGTGDAPKVANISPLTTRGH
jgi:hypothetical protein